MNNLPLSQKNLSQRPVLIVDRQGFLGGELALKLSKHYITVLVTPRPPNNQDKIIHVPFIKKIPTIPDNYYSYIFLIDDGKILIHSIPSFIKKARVDQSRMVLIEGIRSANQKSIDEARFYKNANVFFYGDLFSEKKALGSIGDFIAKIKETRNIKIAGDGLEEFWPIFLEDFLDCLIKNVFVSNNPSKIINVFPKSPITELGLARILQSIDPLIIIDFLRKKPNKEEKHIENGEYVLDEKYDLRGRIKKILEDEVPEDFNDNEPLLKQVEEKRFIRGGFMTLLLFIIFFLALPLLTTLFYSGVGFYELDNLKNNLQKGNLNLALKSAKDASTFFRFAGKTSIPLKTEASIFGKENNVDRFTERIYLGQSVSDASVDLIMSGKIVENITQGLSLNPSQDFSQALSLMKNSVAEFRRIEAQKSQYPELNKKLTDLNAVVDLISNSIAILPNILGFEKEMKFMVLLQNNMELRAGGGFIGSYAIVTIKNGIVGNFKIYNVYDADGQLKGHIDPPFPIRRYLPQSNLYLRDSNFDLNFQNNASSAAFFLNLETGEKIDGVAAMDITFVKKILSSIGPVDVLNYNLKVDQSNLFQITEEKSQKNFFAGSTQKQDFLSSLFKSIQLKLQTQKNIPYISLAKSIAESLSQKHLMLASNYQNVEDQLLVNNWSSQIPQASTSAINSFDDFLGINESNLGINKVNYFISRSVSKAQMIDDGGKLSSTISISYKSNSPKDTYKNYLRLILPQPISISQISFDNIAQQIVEAQKNPSIYEAKNYKSQGLEVDQELQNGKTVIGFLVQISPNTLKTISITYSLNQTISLDPLINYSFKFFKQPGIDSVPLDLSVYFPQKYGIVGKKQDWEVVDNRVDVTKEIDSDEIFNFSFAQK